MIDIKAIRAAAESIRSIRINTMVIDRTTALAMCDEIDRLRTAPEQPAVEPACWEWRWFDANPNTVTFGQWSEWKRVEPRNALCTVEDSLNEFRTYIANGQRYELRPLFTTPQAQPAVEPVSNGLRDRLVAISAAIAEQDDRAAQQMIRELLAAPQAQQPVVDERAQFNAAINFAISQGIEAGVFLDAWRHGDTSEWPEFQPPAAPKPDRTGMLYYKNDSCTASSADAPECICWVPRTTPKAQQGSK